MAITLANGARPERRPARGEWPDARCQEPTCRNRIAATYQSRAAAPLAVLKGLNPTKATAVTQALGLTPLRRTGPGRSEAGNGVHKLLALRSAVQT